jgi:glycosyltransferase involved in cell wall biosynthesis
VITPAAWFLEEERVPLAVLEQRLTAKAERAASDPPVVLFVAHLDPWKGVHQLLAALERLDQDQAGPITVRVLGTGQLVAAVDALARRLSNVRIELLEPVPYGREFFDLFDDADCLVAPSLSDEQPRIVFDAASQGVAVIGTRTTGLASVIDDRVTGDLVPIGSVDALADALGHLRRPAERERFAEMGQRAWVAAGRYDHAEMHRRRARFVAELFPTPASASNGRRRHRAAAG